jgi:acetolactate synthase-1/2/3 large subunit
MSTLQETKQMKEVIADAFVAEGVDHHFTVMGNGNMWWVDALAKRNVRTVHARHEHCALGMASGYTRSTKKTGVCSVTNGPGLTQVVTELTIAVRSHLPLVIYSADIPLHASHSTHQFDQQTLTLSTGARFIQVRSAERVLDDVRDAFYYAQFEQRPVVISIPEDYQKKPFPHLYDYTPSSAFLPAHQPAPPNADMLVRVADALRQAKRPILLAGQGAIHAGKAIEALAERTGSLLATTLQAKGLFDGNPYDLGIAGAFGSRLLREQCAEADLVIAFGAALGYHTTEGGYLFAEAKVVQVDTAPRGIWQGQRVADLHLRADALLGVQALLVALPGPSSSGLRTPELARTIAGHVYDDKPYPVAANLVDPREILREIDRVVPKDWDIVCGPAHYFNFVLPTLHGRHPDRWHVVSEFGAIGSALGAAIGVATARGDGKVLLIEGDGSMLMHIQELETMKRANIPLLACIMNDGAYGAEAHKFNAAGLDPSETQHGRSDFAGIARAFGHAGATVQGLGKLDALFKEHAARGGSTVWDIHIADNIPSVMYRRLFYGEE